MCLIFGQQVQAESASLSVKAILPENQFDKDVSFYYLKMEAGATQDIELQLFNSSDKEVTALVSLTAATTNDNGLIDYNLPDKKIDSSLQTPFSKIATTPKEVVVPANKDVTTKITINMPAEEYNGMIVGGINVRAKAAEESKESDKEGGMQIVNEMNYAIGVVLVENEEKVKTDMLMSKVYASQIMGNNTTKATLQNPTAAVIEDLSINAEIFAADGTSVLYKHNVDGYRMAPNSSFDFGVPIGNERYQAGKYRIEVEATSDPKDPEKNGEKQTWKFNKEFTITRAQADALNEKAVDLPPDYTMYYIIGAIVASVLIIGIIVAIVAVRKKRAKEKARRRRLNKQKAAKRNAAKKKQAKKNVPTPKS